MHRSILCHMFSVCARFLRVYINIVNLPTYFALILVVYLHDLNLFLSIL